MRHQIIAIYLVAADHKTDCTDFVDSNCKWGEIGKWRMAEDCKMGSASSTRQEAAISSADVGCPLPPVCLIHPASFPIPELALVVRTSCKADSRFEEIYSCSHRMTICCQGAQQCVTLQLA